MANPKLTIDIDGNSKPLEADLKGLASLAKTTSSVMAGAFAGLTAAFVGVSSKAIGIASDLQEIQNVVDVTFGDSAKIVNEWAKTAQDAFGISELQAKKYSSTLGAMYKSMGLTSEQTLAMSTRLAGLTGDLASFYNLDHEVAFQKIQSGISGEIEPLRQLGINLSVANLEAYALAEGLETAFADMSEAEKSIVRYNYILQQTADAQGDFTRTADGYANQLRSAGVELENLGKSFGELLLPVATEAVAGVRNAIDSLTTSFNNPELQQSIVNIGENIGNMITKLSEFAVDVIPNLIDGLSLVFENIDLVGNAILGLGAAFATFKTIATLTTVIEAFIALRKAIQGAAAAQGFFNIVMSANPIGAVVSAVSAAVGALVYFYKSSVTFKNGVIDVFVSVGKFLEELRLSFVKIWQQIVLDAKYAVNDLIAVINKQTQLVSSRTGVAFEPIPSLDVKPQLQAIENVTWKLYDLDSVAEKVANDLKGISDDNAMAGVAEGAEALTDKLNNGANSANNYSKELETLNIKINEFNTSSTAGGRLTGDETYYDFIGPVIDEATLEGRQFVGPQIDPVELASRVVEPETSSQAGSIIANAITNGIQSTFDSEKSVMENIGQNLIQSLADSMLSWANTLLADTISVIANSITSGMKGALDINSPSKVFAEIGKFNMQGLAEGMSSNVGLVTGKYAGIRDGLVNAFSGVGAVGLSMAGAGGAGGGIVINNINQVPNTTVQTTQKTNASGQTEITNLIVSTVATDIARGGAISQSIDYRSSSNRRVNR